MKNILLSLMLISYLIPILYVYFNYSAESPSVSNIICKKDCQRAIMLGMISMGIFTICYEIHRKDMYSLLWIICVLIGIYGVIFINENNDIHYFFAFLVFFCILGFMRHHCRRNKDCKVLYTLLILQLLLLPFLMHCDYFITSEILLIVNFAVFYLYLH